MRIVLNLCGAMQGVSGGGGERRGARRVLTISGVIVEGQAHGELGYLVASVGKVDEMYSGAVGAGLVNLGYVTLFECQITRITQIILMKLGSHAPRTGAMVSE